MTIYSIEMSSKLWVLWAHAMLYIWILLQSMDFSDSFHSKWKYTKITENKNSLYFSLRTIKFPYYRFLVIVRTRVVGLPSVSKLWEELNIKGPAENILNELWGVLKSEEVVLTNVWTCFSNKRVPLEKIKEKACLIYVTPSSYFQTFSTALIFFVLVHELLMSLRNSLPVSRSTLFCLHQHSDNLNILLSCEKNWRKHTYSTWFSNISQV